jgi:AraC-like DNA-binding protein
VTVAQVHSVPLTAPDLPCLTTAGRAHPRLRPLVLGYGGFRSGSGRALAHRLLPVPFVTLILDRDALLVTGARGVAAVDGPTTWGQGFTVGLSPHGVAALLGVPMAALAEISVPLADVIDRRAAELGERLAQACSAADPGRRLPQACSAADPGGRLPQACSAADPGGRLPQACSAADPGGRLPRVRTAADPGEQPTGARKQFDLLDELLPALVSRSAPPPDPIVTAAWEFLQRPSPPRVGAVADTLGVSRRQLERSFVRQIGLTPAAVSRIARFQRAVAALSRGTTLADAAAVGGYADQPHLTRETRALAGITPGTLCRTAFIPDHAALAQDHAALAQDRAAPA